MWSLGCAFKNTRDIKTKNVWLDFIFIEKKFIFPVVLNAQKRRLKGRLINCQLIPGLSGYMTVVSLKIYHFQVTFYSLFLLQK